MENFYENQVRYNFRDVQTLHNRPLYISVKTNDKPNNTSDGGYLIGHIIQAIINFAKNFFSFIKLKIF